MMRRVGNLLKKHWRALLTYLIVVAVLYFALFYAIGHLVPEFSSAEISAQGSATSLQAIWNDPINAPFKLLAWVPFKLGLHSIVWLRGIAAFFGVCSALLFYFVLIHLFSRRVAFLTTLLFVFSTGFLHASRLGTPLILQIFGIIVLMASVPLYARTRYKIAPLYISTAAVALLLYIPTMPWFIIVGGIIMQSAARKAMQEVPVKHQVLIPLFFLGLVSPLVWHLIQTPLSALTLLGLPQHLPSLQAMGSILYSFARSLVWRGTGPAEIMLIGAPILNVIEAGLVAAGFVTLIRSVKLRSNLFVLGGLALFVILVALGQTTYLPLIPFLFLLLAGGIFYLLNEWFDVFPLNPIANIIGTAAIVLVVGASVLFHIRSYYIAWPHSTATRQAFNLAQPTDYFAQPTHAKDSIHF